MSRYALVATDGTVANVIEWDGAEPFTLPVGLVAVASEAAAPGWSYVAGTFEPPAAPAPPPPTVAQQYAQRLAAGLAITSTGAPELDATYPIDDATSVVIGGAYAGIKGGDGLPGGGTTLTDPKLARSVGAYSVRGNAVRKTTILMS